jgi:N-acetylmuramoyl-L-alanine amidase
MMVFLKNKQLFEMLFLWPLLVSCSGPREVLSEKRYNIECKLLLPASNHPDGRFDDRYNHWWTRPFGKEGRIQCIVIHTTGGSVADALDRFCDPNEGVSAHYVISKEPVDVFCVVPEEMRARHAGVSYWSRVWCGPVLSKDKKSGHINDCSIGIELEQNDKEGGGFDNAQMSSSIQLLKALIKKYNIHPANIIGHGDIGSNHYKEDPGSMFPWKTLYENGVGAWVTEDELAQTGLMLKTDPLTFEHEKEMMMELIKYGYVFEFPNQLFKNAENLRVLKAFKMHFSENQHKIIQDQVTWRDLAFVKVLNKKYPRSKIVLD